MTEPNTIKINNGESSEYSPLYSDYDFYTHEITGTTTFTFTDTNADPENPGNYGNGEKILARITCPVGSTMKITGEIKTEESYDYITIYNGDSLTSPAFAGFTDENGFHGSKTISDGNALVSSSNNIFFKFTSDDSETRMGWSLTIEISDTQDSDNTPQPTLNEPVRTVTDVTNNSTTYVVAPGTDMSDADLSGRDLSNADLSGVTFKNATLIGTNFNGSSLIGANFTGTSLNNADFSGVDLTDADFSGVNLIGIKNIEFVANLTRTNFTNIHYPNPNPPGIVMLQGDQTGNLNDWMLDDKGPLIPLISDNTIFNGANLQGRYIKGTGNNIQFRGAKLSGSIIFGVEYEGSSIDGSKPEIIVSGGTNWDFSGANLSGSYLTSGFGFGFSDTLSIFHRYHKWKSCNFTGVNFTNAHFFAEYWHTNHDNSLEPPVLNPVLNTYTQIEFTDCSFNNADFSGTDLRGIASFNCDFTDCLNLPILSLISRAYQDPGRLTVYGLFDSILPTFPNWKQTVATYYQEMPNYSEAGEIVPFKFELFPPEGSTIGANLDGIQAPGARPLVPWQSDFDASGNQPSIMDFTNAIITNADISGVDFVGGILIGTNFTDSSLNNADFRNANLSGANLTRANLTNAKFNNANLTGVISSGITEYSGVALPDGYSISGGKIVAGNTSQTPDDTTPDTTPTTDSDSLFNQQVQLFNTLHHNGTGFVWKNKDNFDLPKNLETVYTKQLFDMKGVTISHEAWEELKNRIHSNMSSATPANTGDTTTTNRTVEEQQFTQSVDNLNRLDFINGSFVWKLPPDSDGNYKKEIFEMDGVRFSKAAWNQIKNETVKDNEIVQNKQLSDGVYVFEETLQEKFLTKGNWDGKYKRSILVENDGNVIKLFNIPPKLPDLILEYIDSSQVSEELSEAIYEEYLVLSYNSSSKSYKATDTYTNLAPRLVGDYREITVTDNNLILKRYDREYTGYDSNDDLFLPVSRTSPYEYYGTADDLGGKLAIFADKSVVYSYSYGIQGLEPVDDTSEGYDKFIQALNPIEKTVSSLIHNFIIKDIAVKISDIAEKIKNNINIPQPIFSIKSWADMSTLIDSIDLIFVQETEDSESMANNLITLKNFMFYFRKEEVYDAFRQEWETLRGEILQI